ncbi:MAG TPA: DeoR/GlpR family DNA-binding transcription regulator [Candidatus Dorea intestinavium]|nr:DeoR/GlpR family DNA-binding transcription regulator [Candidatus Dorea intestinavium]
MLAIERRNGILEKLQKNKRVVVGELSSIYKVSEETIRRDLEKLEVEGYAIKSYGGAVLNENSELEIPLNIRKNRNVAEKQQIASLLTKVIHDGDSLMLDASSTAVFTAKALKAKKNLTVITNSVEILLELYDMTDWNILSTGGISREGLLALVGPQTDRMLNSYHVDKAIISCKGLAHEYGLTDSDELHAKNKKTMLDCATEKILAIDSTKFDKQAFIKIGDLDNVTMVVTDKKPDRKWMQVFENKGIECIYPE